MLQPIPFSDFNLNVLRAWDDWFLLAAGDFASGQFNAMTIAWGSIGNMWGKPFAQVVVRPTRYTFGFMEKFDTFTITAFPAEYRAALSLMGSKSGRDGDKISEAGLTPVAAQVVAAPAFAEAELVIECRKVYYDDFEPAHFLADYIAPHYNQDYHRAYFGEIRAVRGTAAYRR